MAGYQLHVTQAGTTTVDEIQHLDDLAERVALERLTHELNPVTPAGYVVVFDVHELGAAQPVAEGHFYVRAAAAVTPLVEPANRSN